MVLQLLKDKTLIVIYPKLLQHIDVLFPETYPLMMFSLVFYVMVYCIHMRVTVRKATESPLASSILTKKSKHLRGLSKYESLF